MSEDLELSYRHSQFVQEYLVDFNGTKAYLRVYPDCTEEAANASGPRLLGKAHIQKAIADGAQEKIKRTQITQDRVLNELALIGFQDIRKIYDEEGNLLPIHELSDEAAAFIAGVEVQELAGGAEIGGKSGIKHIAMQTKKVKLHDKRAALTDMGKHLGLFPNKTELDLPQGLTIKIDSEDANHA